MKTPLIIIASLFACAQSLANQTGDIRFVYWSNYPTTATTAYWTPTVTPSIPYHDGTLGGIYGKALGDSITLVSDKLEANWANLIGKPTALSAFSDDVGFATSSALSGKENTISPGTSAQYYRGDKTWATFPSLFSGAWGDLTGVPSTFTPSAHNQAWSTITSTPTTLSGYGIADAYPLSGNPSGFLTSEIDGSTSNEIELPSMSGQSGKLLSNNGSAATWTDAPLSRSFAYPARTLNSAFQPSSTRDTLASYSVDISTSATLLGGQTGTAFLEIADDSGFTTNVQEVARFVNGNSVSLAIAITIVQNVTGTLTGIVPAGKYARIRTANTVGTPTFTFRSAQETLL